MIYGHSSRSPFFAEISPLYKIFMLDRYSLVIYIYFMLSAVSFKVCLINVDEAGKERGNDRSVVTQLCSEVYQLQLTSFCDGTDFRTVFKMLRILEQRYKPKRAGVHGIFSILNKF
jgi:hypothetical protein